MFCEKLYVQFNKTKYVMQLFSSLNDKQTLATHDVVQSTVVKLTLKVESHQQHFGFPQNDNI